MANSYSQFSKMIEDLSPEACEWVETVLGFDLEDQDDFDEGLAKLKEMLSLENDSVNLEACWPNFRWEIDSKWVGTVARRDLWLYSEEDYDSDHLSVFVQAFIRRFMPDYIFTMTSATTCSLPRVGEFGGEWMVVSKDEVLTGDTWSAADVHAEALRTGDISPKVDDEE